MASEPGVVGGGSALCVKAGKHPENYDTWVGVFRVFDGSSVVVYFGQEDPGLKVGGSYRLDVQPVPLE